MVSRLKLQKRLILHPWFPSSELIHLPQDWWALRIHNLPKSWPKTVKHWGHTSWSKAGYHWRHTICPQVDPRLSSTEDTQPVHKLTQGWLALKANNLPKSWFKTISHWGNTTWWPKTDWKSWPNYRQSRVTHLWAHGLADVRSICWADVHFKDSHPFAKYSRVNHRHEWCKRKDKG